MFKYGKVEIGKRLFAGWDIKNVEPKASLFMSNPVKPVFWSKPFYMGAKFWEHITLFFTKQHFFKSKRTRKLLFTALDRQCSNYQSLACRVGKRGGLEKCGQDMKNLLPAAFFFKCFNSLLPSMLSIFSYSLFWSLGFVASGSSSLDPYNP